MAQTNDSSGQYVVLEGLSSDTFSGRKIEIFKNKNFLFLWASQFLSQLSISFLNFILILNAYDAVRFSNRVWGWHISTNLAASYIVASYGLAAFIFGAPAGVLVDHVHRKNTLIYTTLIRAILVLTLFYYSKSLIMLVLFTFVLNSISQFFYPAEAAIIPNIVKEKLLIPANTIYNLTYFLAQVLGPLIGGFIMFGMGLRGTIYIVSALFALAAICVQYIEIKEEPKSKIRLNQLYKQVFSGISEGLSHIRRNFDTKISLIYLGFIQIIIGIFWALQPGISVEILNIQIEKSGFYIILPLVLGMFAGSILINKYDKQISQKLFVESGILLSSIAFLGIYLLDFQLKFRDRLIFRRDFIDNFNRIRYLPNLNVLSMGVVFMFLIGFASSFIFTIYNTRLQLSTEDKLRGRIYGILQALVTVSGAIPILFTGYIADKFGVKDVFLGMAIFSIALHLVLKFKYKRSN